METEKTEKTNQEIITEIFNNYVKDFGKSPIIDIQEQEEELQIQFEDVFYNKLTSEIEESEIENEISVFISKLLMDFLENQENLENVED